MAQSNNLKHHQSDITVKDIMAGVMKQQVKSNKVEVLPEAVNSMAKVEQNQHRQNQVKAEDNKNENERNQHRVNQGIEPSQKSKPCYSSKLNKSKINPKH